MAHIDDVEIVKLETLVSRAASYCTYVALVDGLLIDSGFAHARQSLFAALLGRTVEQVVNTHAHEDHFGNNQEIADRFGARLYAPEAGLPTLARPELTCRLPYQRIVWGMPTATRAEPLGEEVRTRRFRFQVVPTPGHSRDHVCFHEPEHGWLFGGDLYLASAVKLARDAENGADLIASLQRAIALRPNVLFCYHRGPIEDPLPALERKVRFLQELRDRALELSRKGTRPEEISRRLLGPERLGFRLATSGDFSRTKLVRSLLKEPGEE